VKWQEGYRICWIERWKSDWWNWWTSVCCHLAPQNVHQCWQIYCAHVVSKRMRDCLTVRSPCSWESGNFQNLTSQPKPLYFRRPNSMANALAECHVLSRSESVQWVWKRRSGGKPCVRNSLPGLEPADTPLSWPRASCLQFGKVSNRMEKFVHEKLSDLGDASRRVTWVKGIPCCTIGWPD